MSADSPIWRSLERGGRLDALSRERLERPMTERFTAGLVQMRSGRTPDANIAVAESLIREAAAEGADYVLTPEMTNILDRDIGNSLLAAARTRAGRSGAGRFRGRRRGASHLAPYRIAGDPRRHAGVVNRGYLIGPDGAIARPLRQDPHVRRRSRRRRELARIAAYRAGQRRRWSPTCRGRRLGLTICYDLRFPQSVARSRHAGATVLAIPAAFTRQTGEAHWHVLLRARAIETGSFVIAAAQGGKHEDGRETYGHSLIVDPWGRILAEAGDEPGIIIAEIDPSAELRGPAADSNAAT